MEGDSFLKKNTSIAPMTGTMKTTFMAASMPTRSAIAPKGGAAALPPPSPPAAVPEHPDSR
jgi:hypothetical protein